MRHEGRSAFFGHYTADICGSVVRPDDAVWRRHNDSVVKRVSSHDVFGSDGQAAAYMLFYVLQTPGV